MATEKPVAHVLAELFRRGGMKRSVQRAGIVVIWPRIAGPGLSRFTRASTFRDGILFVETTDSETAMHLGLQRDRFLKAFSSSGFTGVRDIRFRPGRIEDAEEPVRPPVSEADTADLLPLQRSLGQLDLSETVATDALKAADGIALARTRRRNMGWQPCVVCGTLSEQTGLCLTCSRYADEPGTQRAARVLVADPEALTAWLTAEQREVAAWLAAAQVDRLMQTLLPQVLADQRLLPQLELLASNWLVLSLNRTVRELNETDWLQLPERIARVLGRS